MIDFRIVPHSVTPGISVVEVLVDGEVSCVIYPNGEKNLKIVSAHFAGVGSEGGFASQVILDDGARSIPPLPHILITLDPGPYKIEGSQIIKLNRG